MALPVRSGRGNLGQKLRVYAGRLAFARQGSMSVQKQPYDTSGDLVAFTLAAGWKPHAGPQTFDRQKAELPGGQLEISRIESAGGVTDAPGEKAVADQTRAVQPLGYFRKIIDD